MANQRADDGEKFLSSRDHIHGDAEDHPIYFESHKQTYLLGRFGRYIDQHERGLFWSIVGSAVVVFAFLVIQAFEVLII